MSVRLLVPLLLVALAAGLLIGRGADRFLDRVGSSPRPARPQVLERAWRAMEAGDRPALAALLDGVAPASMPTPAFADEVRFLRAVSDADVGRVRALAEEGRGRPLGAQALAWLIDHADDAEERARLETAFAERYPASWRVRPDRGPAGDGE